MHTALKKISLAKIGVLMNTYNRTDDARINMEIIREVWKSEPLLADVVIVHTFNGKDDWWPDAYLEDHLCRTANPGHFTGAELLMNAGMEIFAEHYPDVTHIVTLASDTWILDPRSLVKIIEDMVSQEKYLATSAWGYKGANDMFKIGMSLDFFIVDHKFAREQALFPLRYQEFIDRHGEQLSYEGTTTFLERLFALRFKQAIARAITIPSENLIQKVAYAHIRHLTEREPVHYHVGFWRFKRGVRQMYWPRIGLITHHDPAGKQKAFRKWRIPLGEHGGRFREANDLTYFNAGFSKSAFEKGGQTIGYDG